MRQKLALGLVAAIVIASAHMARTAPLSLADASNGLALAPVASETKAALTGTSGQTLGSNGRVGSGDPSGKLSPLQQGVNASMAGLRTIVCPVAPTVYICVPATQSRPPSVTQIVQTATASITLPTANPVIEPGPGRNQWKMVAVGYPLWLHVGGPTTLTDSASVAGYTISISAVRSGLSFAMGDGSTVKCAATTPWDGNTKAQPSPTCGYSYAKKSPADSPYTVTATASWTITWTGAGQSGSFAMQQQATTQLPVGELTSVLVKGP